MKKIKLIPLLLLLFVAYVPAYSHIFYEVKTDKATVWLLGSIHMADSSFYPLAPVVTNAFDKSDYLVTEVLMDDLMSGGKDILDSLYYPKGDSLPLHIADTTWQRVIKYFKDCGMGRKMVRKLKPSLIVMTISQLEYMKHGYSPNWGMDMYFTKIAGKKSVLQLESIDSQADLISQMGEGDDPDKMITDAFDDLENSVKMIDSIAVAWKAGDAGRLYKLVKEDMDKDSDNEKEFNKKLLDDRNDGMYDKIVEYLKSESRYFVIVGTAHLLGKGGIVEQLRASGYKVEQK